jgi:tetrapyrrole methylase family protein / MazG family protein
MTNQKAAEEFSKLQELADTLMGPHGCPWDQEQTLVSMRAACLEEACEVIEAIDEENVPNLIEELGDLFYIILFFCKLAEKEGKFQLHEVLDGIRNKLIARHPHVFGESVIKSAEAALNQWEEIKKIEKKERESLLDGIPKGLPSLAKGYKIAGKMEAAHYEIKREESYSFHTETELGKLLWAIIQEARHKHLNPENALRKEMMEQEKEFRRWEKTR